MDRFYIGFGLVMTIALSVIATLAVQAAYKRYITNVEGAIYSRGYRHATLECMQKHAPAEAKFGGGVE